MGVARTDRQRIIIWSLSHTWAAFIGGSECREGFVDSYTNYGCVAIPATHLWWLTWTLLLRLLAGLFAAWCCLPVNKLPGEGWKKRWSAAAQAVGGILTGLLCGVDEVWLVCLIGILSVLRARMLEFASPAAQ